MGLLRLRHLPAIALGAATSAQMAETFADVQAALDKLAGNTATATQGVQTKPPAPSKLAVIAQDGIFDIAITDNNPHTGGVSPEYFLEYSLTKDFRNPSVIHLGPARTHRAHFGNQRLYWRAYSQLGRGSKISDVAYFGAVTAPTPVTGGGAFTGPPPLASTGSGTAPITGLGGAVGYGRANSR